MSYQSKIPAVVAMLTIGLLTGPAHAGGFDFNSGSDGSDGALAPSVGFAVVIDLSLAATASFDTPSPVPGQGVYDAEKWAVVFKYTTIDIPNLTTISFINHPSGASVIWLVSGDVTIGGEVNVDAANGTNLIEFAAPGPGGFAGGPRQIGGNLSSAGYGPGGSPRFSTSTGGAGHAGGGQSTACVSGESVGAAYSNVRIVPLIGGSGAGAATGGGGGGAGGGAILIASSGNIFLDAGSLITAKGGNGITLSGGGSGGAIRLIANTISGAGLLRALAGSGSCNSSTAGNGSVGRIRVDADVVTLTDFGSPTWTTDMTHAPVFPPVDAPTLVATLVDAQAVPTDPIARVLTTDLDINNASPVTVNIQATNIPDGTTVNVRVAPARGDSFVVVSTPLIAGNATATITFPPGKSEMQLRANWTP